MDVSFDLGTHHLPRQCPQNVARVPQCRRLADLWIRLRRTSRAECRNDRIFSVALVNVERMEKSTPTDDVVLVLVLDLPR